MASFWLVSYCVGKIGLFSVTGDFMLLSNDVGIVECLFVLTLYVLAVPMCTIPTERA